ncbi:hypothetical protein QJQ45_013865 [Haematococcus lacustris]|nr:hypothetical protein QJQ45_013865 [Haematococcus lacustris]
MWEKDTKAEERRERAYRPLGQTRPACQTMAEYVHHGSLHSVGHVQAAEQPMSSPASPTSQAAAWGAGPRAPQHAVPMVAGVRHNKLKQYTGAAELLEQQARHESSMAAARQRTKAVAGGVYQKEAAIRAAERAIRPWSAITGLGERQGAPAPGHLLQAEAAAWSPPRLASQAPAYQPPGELHAEAVAAAAAQVSRPGMGQRGSPGAWSPMEGQPARELWPQDLALPPKYCAGCRGAAAAPLPTRHHHVTRCAYINQGLQLCLGAGSHDVSKERNAAWEPYTPAMRLQNLNCLPSKFQTALVRGQLCVALNDSSIAPVRWTWKTRDADGDETLVQPGNMDADSFARQLSLMFEGGWFMSRAMRVSTNVGCPCACPALLPAGLREGHEPYRHLASQAVLAFLASRSPHLVSALPSLVPPLRLALQTYEPSLVGHALLMMQRLLRAHPGVGSALAPHLRHLLPVLALFRRRHFELQLPPPFCLAPAGSFTGSGLAPEAGARKCTVCGYPVDKEVASQQARAQFQAAAEANPHLLDSPRQQEFKRAAWRGRASKRYVLQEVINETLELLVAAGGGAALKAVQHAIPTFCYHNP